MLNGRALRTVGTIGVVALLGAGCTGSDQGGPDEPPTDPQPAVIEPGGPYARAGVFGLGTQFRAQLEIEAVERREDRTVMRFTTTPLQEGEHNAKGGFEGGFRLADTMDGRVYEQLPNPAHEKGDTADPEGPADEYVPKNLGNDLPDSVVGDAEYVMEAHFPPLPDDAERITVLTPGTAGELTGVPVTEPEEADEEEEPSDEGTSEDEEEEEGEEERGIRPGDVIELPVVDSPIPDDTKEYVSNLYSVTEQGDVTHHSGRTAERVTLRTEGLFAEASGGDEATGDEGDEDGGAGEDGEDGEGGGEEEPGDELTANGRKALDDVAEDIAEEIDPDDNSVTIGVHSDGEGKDEENAEETSQRAALVSAYLDEILGEDVSVSAEGHGSDRPVAEEKGAEKVQARQRNARIEISYKVPPPAEKETEGEAGGSGGDSGEDADGGGSASAEDPTGDDVPSPGGTEESEGAEEGADSDNADEGGSGGAGAERAPYRAQDPDVIANTTATVDGVDYRLQVMPFYRDGRFLVANFVISNKSPENLSENETPFASADLPGAVFGSFSASDSESGETYRAVRIGGGDTLGKNGKGRPYLEPVSYPYAVRTNEENRTWVYLPAPPEGVTSLSLNAGAFGEIEDVPIE